MSEAVSVVICAYTSERWEELLRAVASAEAQSAPAADVIVVIDHAPELLERARAEISGATVIPNGRASGLSGARNAGAGVAGGSIVAFLDDDAEADERWLQQLAAAFTGDDVLGAGGRIVPRWLDREPRWFPAEFLWVVGCTYKGLPEHGGTIRNPIGANMAVRADALREIDGFREGVGARHNDPAGDDTQGTDETELAIRASQRWPERRWVYAPQALVRHDVPGSRSSFAYFIDRCRNEGRAKARLSRLRGSGDSLSSEREYVLRALPAAVLGGIGETLRGRRLDGLLRAGAVIAGLAATALGYAREWARGSGG